MENYTDYQLDGMLRMIAAEIGVDSNKNLSVEEIFSAIEDKYPKVAFAFRQYVYGKDRLKARLSTIPPQETIGSNISVEGDMQLLNRYETLGELYPLLREAIDDVKTQVNNVG
ncbi:hypothetical protein A1353_01505 [Methylomonas methanica]|uniref:Uncharacterized protein n=1 Tax=Methylomonas methanica TaxID=421 RepID=A0A177M3V0_METMH|nr:hypothetical protein [Methylomonas methanica]OAI00398.1 hypothetical protein A1353_01505 [Methylomonas methanica]